MNNLHPFLTAVQASYEAHGLPADIEFLHIGKRTSAAGVYVSVQANAPCRPGTGSTVGDAYADAMDKRAVWQRGRDDALIRERARDVLIAAGLSPSLIAR